MDPQVSFDVSTKRKFGWQTTNESLVGNVFLDHHRNAHVAKNWSTFTHRFNENTQLHLTPKKYMAFIDFYDQYKERHVATTRQILGFIVHLLQY